MGQHTWFSKSKALHDKQSELYVKLDSHNDGEIYLDDLERIQINYQIEEIDKQNKLDYCDLFRTNKRNEDGTYIDEIITSKKECFEWIENENNFVTFRYTIFDSEEKIKENKEFAIAKLNDFWEKHPNGVIYFG